MDAVNVQIGKELVEPIIQAKIQAAIVATLNDGFGGLVEKTVAAAMYQKVDRSDGKPSGYSSAIPRIEYLTIRLLENAAIGALTKWAEENQNAIEKALLKELQSTRQTSKLVKAVIDGLAASTKSKWNFAVKLGKLD